MGIQGMHPPQCHVSPQEIAGLILRDYENPLVSLKAGVFGAGYFLGVNVALGPGSP